MGVDFVGADFAGVNLVGRTEQCLLQSEITGSNSHNAGYGRQSPYAYSCAAMDLK